MAGNEIASAYVALTTKFSDSPKRAIENELDKVDGTDAGGKIGDGLGKGISNTQAAIAGAFGRADRQSVRRLHYFSQDGQDATR